MATARHFGVKPTNTSYGLAAYSDEAYLLVQNSAADQNALGQLPSTPGVIWYVGPDESIHQQIIAYTVHEPGAGNGGGYPTEFNWQGDDEGGQTNGAARIAFKGSGSKTWSNDEFIALVDEIANLTGNGPTAINTIDDAVNYINAGSHWTNFSASVNATTEAPATTAAPTYYYWTYYECGNTSNVGHLRTEVIIPAGQAYDVTTGIMSEGQVPSGIIVIQTQADATTPEIILANPPSATCDGGGDPAPGGGEA